MLNAKLATAGSLAGLIGVLLASAATPPSAGPAVPPSPVVVEGPAQASAENGSPLDEPLRLIQEARQSYEGVKDYTCRLVKQERLRGQLQAEQVMTMMVRAQPFGVYLRFLEPRDVAGQEIRYAAGRNNGMMRVHLKGLAGVAGFISIDPRDPRVMQNSRHVITEAGIGNLIERFARSWERERQAGKTQVRLADYQFDGRPCTRVETIHPQAGEGPTYFRSVLYLDKANHLPVRVENYDWLRPGGKPEGELMELFNFADLRLNVNLAEEVFTR